MNNDKIFISKRLLSRAFTQIPKGEELNISYGERSNSFLIVEYGFTMPDNRFDFYRMKQNLQAVKEACNSLGLNIANNDLIG